MCNQCLAGTAATGGKSDCLECPVGEYQPVAGQFNCTVPPSGWIVNVTGASVATQCPAGSIANPTASECVPCAAGTSQPQPGVCVLSLIAYFE